MDALRRHERQPTPLRMKALARTIRSHLQSPGRTARDEPEGFAASPSRHSPGHDHLAPRSGRSGRSSCIRVPLKPQRGHRKPAVHPSEAPASNPRLPAAPDLRMPVPRLPASAEPELVLQALQPAGAFPAPPAFSFATPGSANGLDGRPAALSLNLDDNPESLFHDVPLGPPHSSPRARPGHSGRRSARVGPALEHPEYAWPPQDGVDAAAAQARPGASAVASREPLLPRSLVVAGTAAHLARLAGVPQALRSFRQSSAALAAGELLGRMTRPAATAAGAACSVVENTRQWLDRPRISSRYLQQALARDLADGNEQKTAHREALIYGHSTSLVAEAAMPLLHASMKVGAPGTALAFGAGRSSGLAAGDAVGRWWRGLPRAPGLRAGPELPAATLSTGDVARGAAIGGLQWALGSITGAAGNLAGQLLVAPLVNLLPLQFQAVDPRAVVPDAIVAAMNQLEPGAGDRLRRRAADLQGDATCIASASTVRIGQWAFYLMTAARHAALGGQPLGAGGQVAAGVALSAGAGFLAGAAIGVRQMMATLAVPDLDKLEQMKRRASAGGPDVPPPGLQEVPTREVPLFYAHRIGQEEPAAPDACDLDAGLVAVPAAGEQVARLQAQHDAVASQWQRFAGAVRRPLAAMTQAWGRAFEASGLAEPAAPGSPDDAWTARRVRASVSNTTASLVRRSVEMGAATRIMSLMSTAGALFANCTEGLARRGVLMAFNVIGVHFAIKPWFDSLATTIPQGDRDMRERRLEHVKEQAA
jgi:hypothetical protein